MLHRREDVEFYVDTGSPGLLRDASRVIEQEFVAADLEVDRGNAGVVTVQRRGVRVVTVEAGADEAMARSLAINPTIDLLRSGWRAVMAVRGGSQYAAPPLTTPPPP